MTMQLDPNGLDSSGECLDLARAALTAAIGAGGRAVAVKALEWYDPGNRIEYADTLLGSYKVNASGSWWLDNGAMEHCGSLEAAKAAAQADFERRILSVIAHPVQPGWREVGEAGTMPGTSGFTMACFDAAEIPVGTKLYAAPQPKGE